MREQLEQLQTDALEKLDSATSLEELEQTRVRILGKKGELTALLRGLGKVSPEERPVLGSFANQIKKTFAQRLAKRQKALEADALEARLQSESLDVTLPGRAAPSGGLHPITRAHREMTAIFRRMGFETAKGPEIENDWYNFEALNIPADHPAPGRGYRCDSDVTHTPMFHQVEGFMVDEGVHFGQLKGLLESFLVHFFERELPVRFRPSFFPFTEPSAEVDMGCLFCDSKGCRICKGNGWLEVLGCGMIHPVVLSNVGMDTERYSGFAFGMGVERLAMLKYGIDDLRNFFENDARFLARYASHS